MTNQPRELTEEDKRNAFIIAVTHTTNAKERWKQRSETELSDADLAEALAYELGWGGGSSANSKRPNVFYERSGLKIWADWQAYMPGSRQPTFEGKKTMDMARVVFNIADPDDDQMTLF